MDVHIHHLLRQLRDTGWNWHEIAVAFPELGLDPAVDYAALANAALQEVIPAATAPAAADPPAPEVTLFRGPATSPIRRGRHVVLRRMSPSLGAGR
jgi:hypothetical protein